MLPTLSDEECDDIVIEHAGGDTVTERRRSAVRAAFREGVRQAVERWGHAIRCECHTIAECAEHGMCAGVGRAYRDPRCHEEAR